MSLRRLLGIYRTAGRANIEAGRRWYQDAFQECLDIAESYGEPVEVVAALVAILSPNNQWNQNLDDACTVIEYYHYSGVDDASECKLSTYTRNRDKAFSVLWEISDGVEPKVAAEHYARGPKVSAFLRAILGDRDALVLDSHCINAWYGRRIEGSNLSGAATADRRKCIEDYTHGASVAGESVASFQAIIWIRHLERIAAGRIPGYSRLAKQGG